MASGVLIFGLFGCFLVVVICLAIFGGYLAKKRREELAALAASRGWVWAARDDRWCTYFRGQPFGEGHSLSAKNVLTGLYDGRGFVSFDYRFHTTESSTDAQGHHTSRGSRSTWSCSGATT